MAIKSALCFASGFFSMKVDVSGQRFPQLRFPDSTNTYRLSTHDNSKSAIPHCQRHKAMMQFFSDAGSPRDYSILKSQLRQIRPPLFYTNNR